MVRNVRGLFTLVAVALCCLLPATSLAQSPRACRLLVTVVDPSGGLVQGANVNVIGLEGPTRVATIEPVKTSVKGVATIDGLRPGRYSVQAEFPGFDLGLVRDIRLREGDNKHVVVLPLKKFEDSVTVGVDRQQGASSRSQVAFGQALSKAEIDALSDDPTEMERQLTDLAGHDAVIRVDSFEGQPLPPRSQIKSIHVTRDQFAAETESPGSTFVDVITQAGVGPLRGGLNLSFRDGSMTGRSQFVTTKGPEQARNVGGNIGGTLLKNKVDFALSVNGSSQYSTPILHVVLPSGSRSEVMGMRQPWSSLYVNGLTNVALPRDQTLRLGYTQSRYHMNNIGVGAYDLPERAYSTLFDGIMFRVLEAGAIGRRLFINSRLSAASYRNANQSSVDAPTVVVQDAFTSGGAQQAGSTRERSLIVASDLDYVRGSHSWRAGIQATSEWYHSDASSNQLGTFTFSSVEAFESGTPILFTRTVGDPTVAYFNWQTGLYIQDDIRIRKALTLSPGVRYSLQTHVHDRTAFEPRFGLTWSPSKAGRTTYRTSAGIFHGWMSTATLEQTLRFDGTQQRESIIISPSYPDPGPGGIVGPTNEYLLGDYRLQKNVRLSGGIEHKVSDKLRVTVLYNYFHQIRLPRGQNLNAPVDGVRPDPSLANVIRVVTDAQIRRHELFVTANLNLSPKTAGNAAAVPRFDWRRLVLNANFSSIRARRNAGEAFYVSPSGTLDTEWGPGPADRRYLLNLSLVSTQLRNWTNNVTVSALDGSVYTLTTGVDDNHDGLINDRPAGVGLNGLRTTGQLTLSLRTAYAFSVGRAAAGSPTPRNKVNLFVNANNLTNHANFGGFSGVMTSPFFMKPTRVNNPRRIDLGMNVSF